MFLEQWCLVVLREDPRGYGEGDWAGCMWRGINGRLIVPWMVYSRATQEQLPRGYYREIITEVRPTLHVNTALMKY